MSRSDNPAAPVVPRWLFLAAALVGSILAVALAFDPMPHDGGDNASYLSLAFALLRDGAYVELWDPAARPHTVYPPVFPAIFAALMALGARTWAAFKLVAAASTVAAVVCTFLWTERKLDARWALGVAVALGLAPAVLYYSHIEMSDATFLLFVVLALASMERADEAWGEGGSGSGAVWAAVGIAATGLAYFTRTAGLPLLVALFAWLALRRRWRVLGAAAVALGIPFVLWSVRARMVGNGVYANAFWLADPYNPSLGRVGVKELAERLLTNLRFYVLTDIPRGLAGMTGPAALALGLVLAALALAGWTGALRRRVGPTEIFLPLYFGLLLVWPAIWSGDRFALPLYPIVLLYGARFLGELRIGKLGPAVAGALLGLMTLPALMTLALSRGEARECAELVREQGAFACYGPEKAAFIAAAEWAGANLPAGSAALTRKPTLFYVMSGVPSRTFPYDRDPDAHLALADGLGARYELSGWDGVSEYMEMAAAARPEAFCGVQSFGERTVLVGILPPDARTGAHRTDETGALRILACPAGYVIQGVPSEPRPSDGRIPLLAELDR